jgi:tetratricopeptide (TPR) repeat protein
MALQRTILAAALILVAPAAMAEQRDQAVAREHYRRGEQLFLGGDYVGALEAFRSAYRAAPHPVVLKSLAACHHRLRQYRVAAELYERYLRERPGAPDRAEVEAELARLRATPGTVRLVTQPAGAQVTVDGARVEGSTPAVVSLAPGRHAVAFDLAGYSTAVREFTVEFGAETTVEATLEPGAAQAPALPPPAGGPAPDDGVGLGSQAGGAYVGPGTWVALAITAAALASGAVTGGLALAAQDEFNSGIDSGRARSELGEIGDRGQTLALVSDISFGAAILAGAATIVLLVLDLRRPEPEPDEGLQLQALSPGRGGLGAVLSF